MGVRRVGDAKRAFATRLEIGIENQTFLGKPEVGIIPINCFDSCNDSFFCRNETHTAQESASQL